MNKKKYTYILLLLSIVWAVLIFVLCTIPSNGSPKFKIPNIDKIVHFGFFFVQSILLCLFLNFQTKYSFIKIVFISTILIFLYGGLIEIFQQEFFFRTCDIYDLIADVSGGFSGAIIYPVVIKILRLDSKNYTA
jgi:VanZ family protein